MADNTIEAILVQEGNFKPLISVPGPQVMLTLMEPGEIKHTFTMADYTAKSLLADLQKLFPDEQ